MDDKGAFLIPGQHIKPPNDLQIVKDFMKNLYGMQVIKINELNAYDDRNYHVICEEKHTNPNVTNIETHGYVLKIVNSMDSQKTDIIEAQTEMLLFVNEKNINCPVPVKNLKGNYYSIETIRHENTTQDYAVRLLIYLPGEILYRVPITGELLYKVGNFAAKLDEVLKDFSHSAYERHKTLWMLTSVPKLRQFTFAVKNVLHRQLAHDVILAFENEVLQVLPQLEVGMIHGDINDQNLVVTPDSSEIAAVIDFGDAHKSYLFFEMAITLCYMILSTNNLQMGKYVLEGYQNVRKVTDLEKRILKTTVCARTCQSLIMGAYTHLSDPQNEYLLITQKTGWNLLKELWSLSHEDVLREWKLKD